MILTETTHTVPNGTTYTIREVEVDVGYTGRKRTIWEADNFHYFQDSKDELTDMLDYMTVTWDNQHVD